MLTLRSIEDDIGVRLLRSANAVTHDLASLGIGTEVFRLS